MDAIDQLHHFVLKFVPGDTVLLKDGDGSLKVTVTQVNWEGVDAIKYEVSWIHNGDVKSVWVSAWRVNPLSDA